ncbi:hypothetical protein [Marinomonas sp.]|uniref:hypothetical protein n=1 Tax=Marinomonas sp. TaxID=1904862 RepID=UPI003BAAAD0C
MNNLYKIAPEASIPPIGSPYRLALDCMSKDTPAPRAELVAIDDNFRRLLQELEGERFGYWTIDRIRESGSKKVTHYQVNQAHFISKLDDMQARLQRKFTLKRVSHHQAVSESGRLSKASKELHDALIEMENAQKG